MGKGEIKTNLGDGQYSVTLLSNRIAVEENLARLDAMLADVEAQIAELPIDDPDFEGPGLRLLRASLIKQKETLELIPDDQTVTAWCADLSIELSGIVGTIEINGDPDAGVNVRPGYADDAAHDPERDGQLMDIRTMTPTQAFCNLAFLPGWQKWMPTYRIGEITEIDEDTCSVTLDIATSSQQGLDINDATNLDGVQIEYMTCNGAAFAVGDRVIVEYRDRGAANTPFVIGFEQEPQPCGLQIKLTRGDGTPVNAALLTYIKVKDITGAYQTITYDLNPDTGYWEIEPEDPLDDPLKYWIEYQCTDGLYTQYPGKYKAVDLGSPGNRVAIGRYEDTIPYWKVEAISTAPDIGDIPQLPAAWWQAPLSGVARTSDSKYRYIYAGRIYEKSVVVKSSIPYRVRYAVTDDFQGTYFIGYGFHTELAPCDGETVGIALWDTSGACTLTTSLSCFTERPSSNNSDDEFSKITVTTSDGNTTSPSPKTLQMVKPEWVNDQAGNCSGKTHFIRVANTCPSGNWHGYVEYEFNADCEAGYDSVEETLAALPVHNRIADAAIVLIPLFDW